VSEARVDSLEVTGDRAAVTVSWLTREGEWLAWSHVLELDGGRIMRIKDS